jgi:hypothetical protein
MAWVGSLIPGCSTEFWQKSHESAAGNSEQQLTLTAALAPRHLALYTRP